MEEIRVVIITDGERLVESYVKSSYTDSVENLIVDNIWNLKTISEEELVKCRMIFESSKEEMAKSDVALPVARKYRSLEPSNGEIEELWDETERIDQLEDNIRETLDKMIKDILELYKKTKQTFIDLDPGHDGIQVAKIILLEKK